MSAEASWIGPGLEPLRRRGARLERVRSWPSWRRITLQVALALTLVIAALALSVVLMPLSGGQVPDCRVVLIQGLVLAEVVGLAVALGTGALLGRRGMAPLTADLVRHQQFVADASHELRTPIAQVHTRAQLLSYQARNAELPAEHVAELARLISTTRQLGEIVDDLLLSTQQATGPAAERFDLTTVVADAVAAEGPRAGANRVTLEVDRPGAALPVLGVPTALRRVVTSLLDNALRHTPPGGRIAVSLRADGAGRAELVVQDSGSGFDPATRERIFGRAVHGDGANRFGLGLALAREVVTSHGGSIEADGAPEQGARFTVRLPVVQLAPVLTTRA
jgi:two-component system OmpR family sensor kinase